MEKRILGIQLCVKAIKTPSVIKILIFEAKTCLEGIILPFVKWKVPYSYLAKKSDWSFISG